MEIEIKNTILYIIAPDKMKFQGINLIKHIEVFYLENYKMLKINQRSSWMYDSWICVHGL